jgi:putative transcriptional regulator
MAREQLLQDVVKALEQHDFDILVYSQSCLDIAAQKKSFSLLIKVLENIDGFRPEQADELKKLAHCLGASALLVGEKTKTEAMAGNTAYERYEIPAITAGTLDSALGGSLPEKISSKGRVIAEIDADKLKEARARKNLSGEELADAVGLTSAAVYLYEGNRIRALYDVAKEMEGLLNAPLVTRQSIFETYRCNADFPRDALSRKMALFDFDVHRFSKLNFDLIARDPSHKVILREEMARNIDKIVNFSEFFHSIFAIIAEKEKKDLPIISREELKGAASKKDFLRLLREKSSV